MNVNVWEAILATVPATVVVISVMIAINKSTNTRIDDTNKQISELSARIDKRIDDLATRLDKRIDDLRELMILTFGKMFSKEDIDKLRGKTGIEG